jgi:hypothetical protein
MNQNLPDLPTFADRPKRARSLEGAHRICLQLADELRYTGFRIGACNGHFLVFPYRADEDEAAVLAAIDAALISFHAEMQSHEGV